MAIHIKTPEEIAGLRIAGRLASELLDYLTPFVKPGITTGELDKLAYDYTVNVQKCIPACLGYQPEGMTPYPATTCSSINHVVCHGIPGEKKLKHGDIINIDIPNRTVNVELSDEELAQRRAELEAGDGYVAHRDRKVSQALKAYAAFARSADKGATRDPELIDKLSGLA